MATIEAGLDEYLWSAAFAEQFIAEYWEQKPGVFDYPANQYIANLSELFVAISTMPSHFPANRLWLAKSGELTTYADFRILTDQAINLFGPKQADQTLQGFFERMQQHRFGLNIHQLGAALPAIDQRMQAIVSALRLPDQPKVHSWLSDTFLGTYQSTPFGIHRDPASVLALCLLGQRRYYTWPMSYFNDGDKDLHVPDPGVIEKHKSSAEVFDVKAGQLFYWPSNRWHVATSDGQPSAVVQMSAYLDAIDHS